MHRFDCVKVLFPVVVLGEELKDSRPTLSNWGECKVLHELK